MGGIKSAFSILHLQADRLRLPLLRIFPAWYVKSDQYTWVLLIHIEASGENGMWPDLIFLHFFLAYLIYWVSSSSSRIRPAMYLSSDTFDLSKWPALSIEQWTWTASLTDSCPAEPQILFLQWAATDLPVLGQCPPRHNRATLYPQTHAACPLTCWIQSGVTVMPLPPG